MQGTHVYEVSVGTSMHSIGTGENKSVNITNSVLDTKLIFVNVFDVNLM